MFPLDFFQKFHHGFLCINPFRFCAYLKIVEKRSCENNPGGMPVTIPAGISEGIPQDNSDENKVANSKKKS